MSAALPGYRSEAAELAPAYEAVDPARLYRPVAAWLPKPGAHVLDIGAGTGRDAAWFTGRGCQVTAVEPVPALWRHPEIRCIKDQLPELAVVTKIGVNYDDIILTGVWHHLDPDTRKRAIPVLADLLKPAGRVLLRLRHGPSVAARPAFAVNPSVESLNFARHGFETLFQISSPSAQAANSAAGVRWTWLGLRKTTD